MVVAVLWLHAFVGSSSSERGWSGYPSRGMELVVLYLFSVVSEPMHPTHPMNDIMSLLLG